MLFFPSKADAYRWGRKKVKIKILNKLTSAEGTKSSAFCFFLNFFILTSNTYGNVHFTYINDMNEFVNIDDGHYKNVSIIFQIFYHLYYGGNNEN